MVSLHYGNGATWQQRCTSVAPWHRGTMGRLYAFSGGSFEVTYLLYWLILDRWPPCHVLKRINHFDNSLASTVALLY